MTFANPRTTNHLGLLASDIGALVKISRGSSVIQGVLDSFTYGASEETFGSWDSTARAGRIALNAVLDGHEVRVTADHAVEIKAPRGA